MSTEQTEQTQHQPTRLLTVEDAAEALRVSPRKIHQLVREKALICVQLSARERRFTHEQIEEFITSRTIGRPEKKTIDNSSRHPLPSRPKEVNSGRKRKSTHEVTGVSGMTRSPREEIMDLCQ